jgi:transposase-like protein
MTAIVCTALVCAAVVACYRLYLQAQERIGLTARAIEVASAERSTWRHEHDELAKALTEHETRLKRLDVLENARQLKGR